MSTSPSGGVSRHLREEQTRAEVPDRPLVDGADAAVRRVMVRQALARLTPKQRSVIVLRFFEDLSEADTGADWFVQPLGIDDAGNIVGSVRKDPRKSIFEPLIWAPDGQAWQPSIPDFPEALRVSAVALHNGQVIIAATYSERVNRLYWNIDLASQQARSLDLPAGVERISANGWALQGTKASLLFGDTKLRLPNLPDGESPRFTSMSLDGRVIGGYESGAGVLGGVPVVWRCH